MLQASIAKTIYWSLQPLRGKTSLYERTRSLEQTQWLSAAEIEEYAFRKLERLLKHANDTVPFYRSRMARYGFRVDRLQDASDLRKLPVLTRSDLEKNFDSLKSDKIGSMNSYESCSSGSTGQPVRFIQDANFDIWCRAHQLRTYGWCNGWRVGERFALVWGSPIYWDKQTLARKAEAFFTNRIELNCYNVGSDNVKAILDRLVAFRPALISGYSTALYLIAEEARRQNIRIPELRAVQPNAEPTYEYMTRLMEEQFSVPVYDKYGSRETNIVCHQSVQAKDVMCIQSEHTHVEFENDAGIECKPGEEGRLIVTTLNNYSMPLIRYQTSDIGAPLTGTCPSGRGFPLMTKVRGRLHDLILTARGDRIHPQVFSNLFSNFQEVLWFQVVQNSTDWLDISLLMRSDPSRKLESEFTSRINMRTGGNFSVRYRYLAAMPETSTGKHKICICNLRQDSHA
jgi:phenylacetate-CoA ligase